MLLSTQTRYFAELYGYEKAIGMLSDAGFDAYDMSFFCMQDEDCPFNQDDYIDYCLHLKSVADSMGIVCNQAHAPFPSSYGDEGKDEKRFQLIVRSMEAASILGAKIIVVHPKQHMRYAENKDELYRLNMEFYRRLIPYCEKFGITVAAENMWQYNDKKTHIVDSTCSTPEEFCEYIDDIGSKWIVACLDIGHIPLTNSDIETFIKSLGHKRLCALHVHDNDLREDSHTLPFSMKIDFNAVTRALKEIDYKGDFTFEADVFLENFPKELHITASKFMCATGRTLISMIND